MKVELNISPKFYPIFDKETTTIIEQSGRSAGKTTTNDVAAATAMLESYDNNIWYCRAEKSDLRSTIFNSFKANLQAMGVDHLFKESLSPLGFTCLKTGAKCYFSGINGQTDDDLNATKGFTPQHRSLKMFILDEANEVKHSMHITAAETTANKFLKDDGKIIYAYNPPPLKAHWSHSFFNEKIRAGAKKVYTTWEDIRQLLKPATIKEIEKMRETDPLFYRYWYLGEVISFTGMVYPQFKRDKHIINFPTLLTWMARGDYIRELYLGVDEGTVNDSTCVTALGVMASGKAVVLDCYERCPQKEGQQSPSEQSKSLYTWWQSFCKQIPNIQHTRRLWYFDCAEGGQQLQLQFRQDTGEPTAHVQKKNIWGDIKRVRSMLSDDMLYFLVTHNNTTMQLCEDLENYIIDEKTNDIKKGQRDDTIDSLEYATKLYYDRPIG